MNRFDFENSDVTTMGWIIRNDLPTHHTLSKSDKLINLRHITKVCLLEKWKFPLNLPI